MHMAYKNKNPLKVNFEITDKSLLLEVYHLITISREHNIKSQRKRKPPHYLAFVCQNKHMVRGKLKN